MKSSLTSSDAYGYGFLGLNGKVKCYLPCHGFKVTYFMRMAKNGSLFLRWFYRLMFMRNMVKFGVATHWSLTVGKGLYIGHLGGIVINPNAKIGDNVLIAPLTLVNFDVPSNSIVIGNPARIIPNEHATEGYINRCV